MINIKSNGQKRVFISHTSRNPFPVAYAGGRYCYPPAFPHPPIEIIVKARKEVAA